MNNITSGNLICDISDHLPNIVLYGNNKQSKDKNCRKFVRIYNENNINKFMNYLEEESTWEELEKSTDCNEAYNIYTNKIE